MASIGSIKKKIKKAQKTMRELENLDALLKSMDRHREVTVPDEVYYNNVKRTRNNLLSELDNMFA